MLMLMNAEMAIILLNQKKNLKSSEHCKHAVDSALHAESFREFGPSQFTVSVLSHVELIFCDSWQIKLKSPCLVFIQSLRESKESFFLPPTSLAGTHTQKDKTQTLRCIKSEELTDGIKQWEQMKDEAQYVCLCACVRVHTIKAILPFLKASPENTMSLFAHRLEFEYVAMIRILLFFRSQGGLNTTHSPLNAKWKHLRTGMRHKFHICANCVVAALRCQK